LAFQKPIIEIIEAIAGKILITPFQVNIAEKTVIEIKNNKYYIEQLCSMVQ
jgi:hypothetical protein